MSKISIEMTEREWDLIDEVLFDWEELINTSEISTKTWSDTLKVVKLLRNKIVENSTNVSEKTTVK